MMHVLFALTALLAVPAVHSGCCPNACSGHGSCDNTDTCTCFANWQMGEMLTNKGDCSDRTCPFDIAWADKPNTSKLYHQYAECSNKGVCNRKTGECSCVDGYEGLACSRMACPNNCSGNGRCMFADQVGSAVDPVGSTNGRDVVAAPYYDWDLSRTRVCACDAGWEGIECNFRSCPYGPDVMVTTGTANQVQTITLTYATGALQATNIVTTDTFALSFTTKTGNRYTTDPITVDTHPDLTGPVAPGPLSVAVAAALKALPGGVVDGVTVFTAFGSDLVTFTVTFTGGSVLGDQNLLEVEYTKCAVPGCTPYLTGLNLVAANSGVAKVAGARPVEAAASATTRLVPATASLATTAPAAKQSQHSSKAKQQVQRRATTAATDCTCRQTAEHTVEHSAAATAATVKATVSTHTTVAKQCAYAQQHYRKQDTKNAHNSTSDTYILLHGSALGRDPMLSEQDDVMKST